MTREVRGMKCVEVTVPELEEGTSVDKWTNYDIPQYTRQELLLLLLLLLCHWLLIKWRLQDHWSPCSPMPRLLFDYHQYLIIISNVTLKGVAIYSYNYRSCKLYRVQVCDVGYKLKMTFEIYRSTRPCAKRNLVPRAIWLIMWLRPSGLIIGYIFLDKKS